MTIAVADYPRSVIQRLEIAEEQQPLGDEGRQILAASRYARQQLRESIASALSQAMDSDEVVIRAAAPAREWKVKVKFRFAGEVLADPFPCENER